MKVNSTLTFAIFMLLSLFRNITTECLSSDNLRKIGFVSIKENAEKIKSPTYCIDLFSEQGTCVNENEIKNVIKSQEDKFTSFNKSVISILKAFDYIFETVGETISNINEKYLSKDKTNELNWQEKIIQYQKNVKETSNDCFIFYNILQHGTTCLVASGLAIQYIKEVDSTWKFTSNLNALELVNKCMDVSLIVCNYFWLTKPKTENQKILCENILEYEKCINEKDTNENCLTNIKKEEIFKQLFDPYGNKWLPLVEDVEITKIYIVSFYKEFGNTFWNYNKNMEEVNQNTESNITKRMLQEEKSSFSSVETEYSFNTKGYDFKKGGAKSGIEKKFVDKSSIFKTLIFIFLLNKS